METVKTELSLPNEDAIIAEMRKPILEKTQTLSKECSEIVVKDEKTAEKARELMKECTKFIKDIEEKRLEYTAPLNKTISTFIEEQKALQKPVNEAKEIIQKKQLDYANEIERKRLEEEKGILDIIAKIDSIPDETDFELAACDYEVTTTYVDTRIIIAIENRRNFFSEQKRMADLRKQQAEEQKRLDEIARQQGEEAARLAQEASEVARRKRAAEEEAERVREDARRKELERIQEEEAKKASKSSSTG